MADTIDFIVFMAGVSSFVGVFIATIVATF
jgi:hypothetical protein